MSKRFVQLFMAVSLGLQALAPAVSFGREQSGAAQKRDQQQQPSSTQAPMVPPPKVNGATPPSGRRPLTNREILARVNANYAARTHAARRATRLGRIEVMTETIAAKKAFKPVKLAGHQFQTIMLISILSAMGVAHEKAKMREIQGAPKQNFFKNMMQEIGPSTALLVDSGGFWSSVAGGTIAGVPAQKASTIMQNIIFKPNSKSIFKTLLASGVTTFLTFIGWEIGGQLFDESIELLENDDDYHQAKEHFGSMLLELAKGTLKANDRRIVSAVFLNMQKIVFTDDTLREMWLYNTWRNRIATGEFATIVSSMVAFGTAGGLIGAAAGTAIPVPVVGTIVGWSFGVAGGIAGGAFAMFVIPEEQKDGITAWFRDLRKGFWMMFDDKGSFRKTMGTDKELYFRVLNECLSKKQPCPPLLLDSARRFDTRNMLATENYISIQFEEFMYYEKAITHSQSLAVFAIKSGNEEKKNEYLKKSTQLAATYRRKLGELKNMYGEERRQMDSLAQQYPLKPEWARNQAEREALAAIQRFRTRVGRIHAILTAYATISSQEIFAQKKSYYPTLYKIYFAGFKESLLLESMAQIATPVERR